MSDLSDLSDLSDFVFFWGGCFSQWYKADMTICDVTYNCCEQFMMVEKSILFQDYDTFAKIMQTNNPREQKRLGRQVKDFDADVWNNACRDIVYKGNLAKFQQNQECYDELMATGNKTIVEASPYDKIWGIGLSKDDPRALDRSKWQGTNWLGKEIMKVRETLRS